MRSFDLINFYLLYLRVGKCNGDFVLTNFLRSFFYLITPSIMCITKIIDMKEFSGGVYNNDKINKYLIVLESRWCSVFWISFDN